MKKVLVSLVVSMMLVMVGCGMEIPVKLDTSNWAAFLSSLQSFTVADLDNATADAVAHNDAIGAACWPVLKKYVEKGLPDLSIPDGLASKIQRARDLRQSVAGGIPTDLRLGCDSLLNDLKAFGTLPVAGK